mgnify:CR=1 FL=1
MKRLRAAIYLCLSLATLLIIIRPVFLLDILNRQSVRMGHLAHPYDWLAHFAAYGALTIFTDLFLCEIGKFNWKTYRLRMTGALLLFAAFDEITQSPALQKILKPLGLGRPLRDASFMDWLSDALGILAAMSAFYWLKVRSARRKAVGVADEPAVKSTDCAGNFIEKNLSDKENTEATTE